MDAGEDVYVSCPYDKAHRVPRSRIQRHLIKCEKMYPELSICPYNATHRVPKDMKHVHSATCPNKPKEQPPPKSKKATIPQGGAVSAPTPIYQEEYLSKDDPEYESWD